MLRWFSRLATHHDDPQAALYESIEPTYSPMGSRFKNEITWDERPTDRNHALRFENGLLGEYLSILRSATWYI
jgi:hypothetical protein